MSPFATSAFELPDFSSVSPSLSSQNQSNVVFATLPDNVSRFGDNVDDNSIEPPRDIDPDDDQEPESEDGNNQDLLSSQIYQSSFNRIAPPLLAPIYQSSQSNSAIDPQQRPLDSSSNQERPGTTDSEQIITPESVQSGSTIGEGSSSRSSQSTSYDTNRSSDTTEEIPEGVDPSFLEALPPEMRREVSFILLFAFNYVF